MAHPKITRISNTAFGPIRASSHQLKISLTTSTTPIAAKNQICSSHASKQHLSFGASWLISVAPPWLAVVLVTHVYFCAVSPFLGVVSVFLVLSDLGSCSWSIYGSCCCFSDGWFSDLLATTSPRFSSSRLASRHLSGCSLWSSRSFKSQ
ncbi:hypothetical protein FCV25MIE_25775 [Fagus crenata]